jgi:trehalose 6-phosphate synthase/phosphatase
MSEEEKAQRQAALYKVVTTHTSHTWAAILVKMLLGHLGTENTAHQTPFMDQERLSASYHSAKKRLLLFDYDVGVPFSTTPPHTGVGA